MYVLKFGHFVLSKQFETRLQAEEYMQEYKLMGRELSILFDPKTFGQEVGSVLHVEQVTAPN